MLFLSFLFAAPTLNIASSSQVPISVLNPVDDIAAVEVGWEETHMKPLHRAAVHSLCPGRDTEKLLSTYQVAPLPL
ncbi:hypothetical protein V8F06_008350 [Rhypophila decipiens]